MSKSTLTLSQLAEGIQRTTATSADERMIGKWNKIPFVGTVGNDRLINHRDGPEVTIHLDLPIKFDNRIYNFIIVKHKDIKEYK